MIYIIYCGRVTFIYTSVNWGLQILACRLTGGAKPLCEPMLEHCYLDSSVLGNKLQWHLNQSTTTCVYSWARHCSKLRKIHSGQGPITLTIRRKVFEQFVLLWFKLSQWQIILGSANSNSDKPIATFFAYYTRELCCQGMHKICSDDQKINYDNMKFHHVGNVNRNHRMKWAPGH